MKEKVSMLVDSSISDLKLHVDDAFISKEEGVSLLNIILDSDDVINLELITEASRIINPLIDDADLVSGEYVLDISSKVKGDGINE